MKTENDKRAMDREPLKINGVKTKVERFFDLYAARFGALTEKDGLDEWRRMIEPDKYDEQSMAEGLDFIANKLGENVHSKKPRIAWVKSEYRKAKDRNPGIDTRERTYCGSCAGTGVVVGIKTKDAENKNILVNMRDIARDGQQAINHYLSNNLKSWVVRHHCHCCKGAAEYAKYYPSKEDPPHNHEKAKNVAEMCLPSTMANDYIAEHVNKWGSMPPNHIRDAGELNEFYNSRGQ